MMIMNDVYASNSEKVKVPQCQVAGV